MSNIQRMIGILGFVVALGTGIENAPAACPTFPTGFTCECNAAETEWVCAKWGQGGTPTHLSDFTVAYDQSGVPDVTLSTADLGWELYSEVISTGAAADMGTLALDNSTALDFEVTISKAKNVTTINLDAPGFTGYSSLEGFSIISGNLGGLTLVQDGEDPPNGGELAELAGLLVFGNLTGPLTVPTVKGTLTVFGNVIGAADITIGKIDGSGITISGSLVCDGVCPDITVTDKIFDGTLTVSGNVPSGSTVKIQQLEEADPATGTAFVKLSNGGGGEFAGTLDLPLGLANPYTRIDMTSAIFSGVIDLHGGAVGLNAEIALYIGTTTAVIQNGGAVSGDVYLSLNIPGFDLQYEGTATFASVTSTGEIGTQTTDPNTDAHFPGILNVTNGMAGLIEIAGSHLLGAEINIGSLSGDIDIEEDCVGLVSISGSSQGDIHIEGILSGIVRVDDALDGVGRILVDGLTAGEIRIGKKTTSLTLIKLGGLDAGGTVEINTTEGKFNAEGAIYVGAGAACVLSPPDVTFDGCIRIYDHDPSENFGNLEGAIIISGCHNAGDLNICVDGSDNGNVNICQTDCPNQVGWSCPIPACP